MDVGVECVVQKGKYQPIHPKYNYVQPNPCNFTPLVMCYVRHEDDSLQIRDGNVRMVLSPPYSEWQNFVEAGIKISSIRVMILRMLSFTPPEYMLEAMSIYKSLFFEAGTEAPFPHISVSRFVKLILMGNSNAVKKSILRQIDGFLNNKLIVTAIMEVFPMFVLEMSKPDFLPKMRPCVLRHAWVVAAQRDSRLVFLAPTALIRREICAELRVYSAEFYWQLAEESREIVRMVVLALKLPGGIQEHVVSLLGLVFQPYPRPYGCTRLPVFCLGQTENWKKKKEKAKRKRNF